MLALLDYEAQLCQCGGYLPETTDPANAGKYEAGDPLRCWRCHASHSKQEAVRKENVRKPESALAIWPVHLK